MAHEDQAYVRFESRGGVQLGTILDSGVVEASSVGAFGRFLVQYAEDHPGARVLLSFSEVEYMSSSTLTELIRVKEVLENSGGKLGICGLRKDVRRVFQITNLEKHMNVQPEEDIAKALDAFTRGDA